MSQFRNQIFLITREQFCLPNLDIVMMMKFVWPHYGANSSRKVAMNDSLQYDFVTFRSNILSRISQITRSNLIRDTWFPSSQASSSLGAFSHHQKLWKCTQKIPKRPLSVTNEDTTILYWWFVELPKQLKCGYAWLLEPILMKFLALFNYKNIMPGC